MKQKLTKLLCSVFLVAFAIPAIAQSSGGSSTRTITGKVTDSEGAPIIGAVVNASQREATTTKYQGRYTRAGQSPDPSIPLTSKGYPPHSETQRAAPSSTSRWRPTTNCSKMSWW